MLRYAAGLAAFLGFAAAIRAEEPAKSPDGAATRLAPGANEAKASPVIAAVFAADGRLVTLGQDATLRCWDLRTQKEVARHSLADSGANALARSSRGVLVPAKSAIHEWVPGNAPTVVATTPLAGQITLSPEGSAWAVSAGERSTAYELIGGKKIGEASVTGAAFWSPAVAPHARYVAAIAFRQPCQVWELAPGAAPRRITAEAGLDLYAKHAFFTLDGRLLVYLNTPGGGAAVFQESATGIIRRQLPLPGPIAGTYEFGADFASAKLPTVDSETTVAVIALSSDGRYLAAGHTTGHLYFHDLVTGRWTQNLNAQRGAITALAFSADGTRLASGGADGATLVWDLTSLKQKVAPGKDDLISTGKAWEWLASTNGHAVEHAVWSLALTPKEALALFGERLKPVIAPEKAVIERWVTELDDAKFAVRQKAQQNLLASGAATRPALLAGLKSATSLEARTRITQLLDKINERVPADRLRMLRALEVLEKIGGADARAQLDNLAKSTDEEIRRDIEFIRRRWR